MTQSETDRIEKVAFAVAERVAREVVQEHVSTCGAMAAVEKLESKLLAAINALTETITAIDKKLVGGDYEFRDVDRRIEEVCRENRALRALVDQYDTLIRDAAFKILLGSGGIAAIAVFLIKVL